MATYQLNKEKLDYNLQVLIERNKEHSAIQSSYKNRLNRLRETLNTLMAKYAKLDNKYKQENEDLTSDYKKLTRQFKDLQEKYHHFQEADEKKFKEVWKMNEFDANNLITQILECDRVIHEQQLGIGWPGASGGSAFGGGLDTSGKPDLVSEAGQSQGVYSKSQNSGAGGSGAGGVGSDANVAKSTRYAPTKVKKVLDLIRDECIFLLDNKVQDELKALESDPSETAA